MHTFLQHRRGDPCGRPWKYGLRFKRAPSSAPFGGTFPLGGGRLFCIGSVGSRNQGAVRKPQQNQILRTQAPSGAGFKRRQALLVLRAGNAAMPFRRVPRKWGVQGMSEYEREALILSSPLGASLASFWASRKKLAARRRRNPPAENHRGGASRRPRPTGETKPSGAAGASPRPTGETKPSGRRNPPRTKTNQRPDEGIGPYKGSKNTKECKIPHAFKKDPASPRPPGPAWTARHSCSASP